MRWMLAFCLLSLCFPAVAQTTGTRIHDQDEEVETYEAVDSTTARRVMNRYGRCVARNNRRVAATVLAHPVRSSEQATEARRIAESDEGNCIGPGGGRLNFHAALLAGAMAEWFLSDALPGRQAAPDLAPRSAWEAVALCIARSNPTANRALIATLPASDEEQAALAVLIPHVGPCLPAGQTFTLGKASLRALVAVGLYRLLSASAPPQ